jgi:hypothetical protein
MLVEDGSLEEDDWWCLRTNFRRVRRGDEVFVYTGERDLGIVGYATVKRVDPSGRQLNLKFDLDKSRALLLNPVPAKVVRKWIPYPRAAVCDVSAFRTELYRRLPWGQEGWKARRTGTPQPPPVSAGFGIPETNRKVERAAVKRVRRRYLTQGWEVTSLEHEKRGFDLLCKKGTAVREVEVKGVRGREVGFLVTAGELRKAREDRHFVLHVVVEALTKRAQIKTWRGKQMLRAFDFVPLQYQAQAKRVDA